MHTSQPIPSLSALGSAFLRAFFTCIALTDFFLGCIINIGIYIEGALPMIRKMTKHLWLVLRHTHAVFIHCAKCGIPLRGLLHDLSKFSPVEFFESVRYYHGARSPLAVCREEKGLSMAWLHHKGRNRHHLEYWVDEDCKVPPLVP